jgi:hypothetical protein
VTIVEANINVGWSSQLVPGCDFTLPSSIWRRCTSNFWTTCASIFTSPQHSPKMDRNTRRDDRGGRRDEPRNQKPRYGTISHPPTPTDQSSDKLTERERSRSPDHERRDDRRRSRSPSRGGRIPPAQRYDRANDRPGPRNPRDRKPSHTPEPGRLGGRGAPRDIHTNGTEHRNPNRPYGMCKWAMASKTKTPRLKWRA